jgi:hypothetical protein
MNQIHKREVSKRRLVGNALIVGACACVFCMAIVMAIRWRTYQPNVMTNSLSLREQQTLTAFGYMTLAIVLGALGLLLRRPNETSTQ